MPVWSPVLLAILGREWTGLDARRVLEWGHLVRIHPPGELGLSILLSKGTPSTNILEIGMRTLSADPGVKATRNNGLDSSLSYFWRGLFMLESEVGSPYFVSWATDRFYSSVVRQQSFAPDVTVYKLPSSMLPIPNPVEEIPLARLHHLLAI